MTRSLLLWGLMLCCFLVGLITMWACELLRSRLGHPAVPDKVDTHAFFANVPVVLEDKEGGVLMIVDADNPTLPDMITLAVRQMPKYPVCPAVRVFIRVVDGRLPPDLRRFLEAAFDDTLPVLAGVPEPRLGCTQIVLFGQRPANAFMTWMEDRWSERFVQRIRHTSL